MKELVWFCFSFCVPLASASIASSVSEKFWVWAATLAASICFVLVCAGLFYSAGA